MSDFCIKVEKLSKRFFTFKSSKTTLQTLRAIIRREPLKKELWVLHDVSFEVKKGDKLALLGRNGGGKTTLLRILTGIYGKTSGDIVLRDNPQALLVFWIGFNGYLSVVENIYLFGAVYGMDRSFLENKIGEILEMSKLSHLRFSLLKELSTGEMQRLALSIFFQNESKLLIFDESFAFIDQDFFRKCDTYFRQLFSCDKTVIITSHDTDFLRKYCRTAIWLDEGRIRMQGEAENVINAYEKSLEAGA